ncbi:MAG: hypothetical protein ABSB88_23900 [Bryobacteraceae bacterium]
MNPARALFTLVLVLPAFGQYAGPAILSRGDAPAAMEAPQIKFQPFLSVSASYSAGLSGVAVVDTQGNLANVSSYGVTFSGGISGSHSWRHTHIGLDYHASYTYYSTASNYNAFNQGLGFGLSHQVTRHIKFSLREALGWFSFNNPNVGLTQTVPFDPAQSAIPTSDFYYTRTIYSTTQADIVIQKSTRLSFDLGGGLFIDRYGSSALYGVTGEDAMGDFQYRLSRRATIGASYSFTHYSFTSILSSSDIHGASLTYALRISRTVEFSGYGGFMRAETKFIQSVPVDPNVAALLGITTTSALVHNIIWAPNYSGRLSKTFARGVLYVAGGETITPGNGLFLTSRAASVMGGYGYTGLRRWSLGVGCTYTTALSISNVNGGYGSISGSFSMSRSLGHSLSFVTTYTATQYRSPNFTGYNRLIYSASVGIGWSPGEVPLRIW